MHLTTIARRRLLAGLTAVAGMIGGSASAQPPAPAPAANVPSAAPSEAKIDKQTGAVIVPLGGAVRFVPGKRVIADVFIRNQDVVAARFDPASPRTLVLTGLMSGASQIIVTFDDKSRATFDVVVQPDYDLLRNVIRRTVPTAVVDVIPGVGNVIILTGFVTRPEDSDTIAKIASSAVGGNIRNVINNLQIGGAQHVLIDVVIAQVDRTELRQRGTNFGVIGSQVGITSVLGGLATRSASLAGISSTGNGGAFNAPINPVNANLVAGIVPAGTVIALQALRTEGLAKFLSEPKVITQTGRPAFLRAGGQQAVLSPSSGINGPGVVLENVGTQLEVLPIVFGNGKIYLEVNPQFRSVNTGRGITTAFGFTPGFNEQQTRSSVLLESGQTFAIGGLLETQVQNSAVKVPYLGDLPLIGFAFSSVQAEERETELIVLVTPRLVDPLDCAQVPRRVPGKETRSPDDYELFIESLIEAPRGQRTVRSGGCYNPAYKCSPTVAGFPCQGNVCTGIGGGAVGVGGAGCANGSCAPAAAPVVPGAPPAALPTLPASGTTGEAPPVAAPGR